MIITRLLGGLGNQMFQYAAGLALAERRRTVLKLDVSWFREYAEYEAHNRYALGCLNVTEQFATEDEIDRVRGPRLTRTERWSLPVARLLHFRRYAARNTAAGNHHRAKAFGFYPEFVEQPDGTYLDGMWQSERFFADAAGLLRLHFSFRYPATPPVAAMEARIRAGHPSAAVHFRRGDYARNPLFNREIGVLPLDYYYRAVSLLLQKVPGATLYVFSDDIDGIEREFHPNAPHVFVRATHPWNSHDKVRLMSQCDHAIISNSTFAWWGAWLNPSPSKVVIAPDPWFAASAQDTGDVVPAAWLRLASNSSEPSRP
ncbi:MAG: alpha-1,2-fucosyltransferase [Opitutaceae bacterium]|jgi:hypothetical protein